MQDERPSVDDCLDAFEITIKRFRLIIIIFLIFAWAPYLSNGYTHSLSTLLLVIQTPMIILFNQYSSRAKLKETIRSAFEKKPGVIAKRLFEQSVAAGTVGTLQE